MKIKVQLLVGAFSGPLAGNAVIALIPTLQRAFDVPVEIVVLTVTLYMVPFATMQIFSGNLSDLFGRRIALAFGFYVYAFGALISALSPNIMIFLVARVIQGFGSAFIIPIIMAILGDTVPFEDRGKAMGLLGGSTSAGVATGPLLAGLFATSVGWRWVFILIFLLTVLLGTIFLLTLHEEHRPVKKEVKGSGEVFSLLWEAFSDRRVLFLGACAFLMFFSYIGAITFTADFLDKTLSLRENLIGFILFSAGIASVIMAPFSGFLVDRIGRKKMASIGFIVMATAFVLLSFANSFISFVILFFLLGCGTAMSWAGLNTLAVEIMPKARGTVTSIYNSFRFFGYAISPLLLSPIYLSLNMGYLYLVCSIIVLLNLLLLYSLKLSYSPSG